MVIPAFMPLICGASDYLPAEADTASKHHHALLHPFDSLYTSCKLWSTLFPFAVVESVFQISRTSGQDLFRYARTTSHDETNARRAVRKTCRVTSYRHSCENELNR